MKIRKEENGPVEYVKLTKCEDCGDVVIKDGEVEITGPEFLANDFQFVEIGREEIAMLNEFLSDAGHFLRVGWDYIEFTNDKEIQKMIDEEEGDKND